MGFLFEQIDKLNSELSVLCRKYSKRQRKLLDLTIGQKIYTQEGGGYLEPNEFYPVIVREIDHVHARVLIREESLGVSNTAWASKNIERYIETFEIKM